MNGLLASHDVALLDWVTITQDANYSWRWQSDQDTHLAYKGMSEQQFADHGTAYATSLPVS